MSSSLRILFQRLPREPLATSAIALEPSFGHPHPKVRRNLNVKSHFLVYVVNTA